MDFARILRAAETLANFGQAARQFRSPARVDPEQGGEAAPPPDLTSGNRVFGQLEARLAGVLVSALKEAFDRDRVHLEMEREQIEQERKRTDDLMRLELLRQAGERELVNLRAGVVIALVVWMTSVLFMMVHRGGFGAAGLVLLALGWALLVGALAASFLAWRHVAGVLLRAAREPLDATALERHPLAPTIATLIVLGLGCTAASMLVALAG
jgi:hypothetical protein